MTTEEQRPANWDWVKARSQCSAGEMFAVLVAAARENVAARNAYHPDWKKHERFAIRESPHSSGRFTVMETFGFTKPHVALTLRDEQIVISQSWKPGEAIYSLALGDDGHCWLSSDGVKCQPWQVLRNALEGLLFRPLE